MHNLRAGLLGVGMMGRHHARVLREIDGVDLVAIADPGGDPHGVAGDLQVLDSVQAIIDTGVDYCVIAIPTAYHRDAALALADAGVHALIEKPIAASGAGSVTGRPSSDSTITFTGLIPDKLAPIAS